MIWLVKELYVYGSCVTPLSTHWWRGDTTPINIKYFDYDLSWELLNIVIQVFLAFLEWFLFPEYTVNVY